MLLHDYACQNLECAHIEEVDHPHYEKPDIKCPKCSGQMNKMIGGAGFLLKGEGWDGGNRVRNRRH